MVVRVHSISSKAVCLAQGIPSDAVSAQDRLESEVCAAWSGCSGAAENLCVLKWVFYCSVSSKGCGAGESPKPHVLAEGPKYCQCALHWL